MRVLSQEIDYAIKDIVDEYTKRNKMEVKYSPTNLRDRFNFYGIFQYLVMDVEIYVSMHKETFRNFEYYLGMEYDRDLITSRFEYDDRIVLFYEGSDRLLGIIEWGGRLI